MSKQGKLDKIDWSRVDWGQQDITLAVQNGCSREAVRQARNRLRGGAALTPRQRTVPTSLDKLRDIDTSGLTLPQLAVLTGCKHRQIVDSLNILGKTYVQRPKGNAKYDWSKFPKDWVLRTDKDIAILVGVANPAVVTQWRIRHGYSKQESLVV
jgi:hypothetical protein